MNIQFIGDLSIKDAEVLEAWGRRAGRVLEFGSGGSTQIFDQCGCNVISVETSPEWVAKTKRRVSERVQFVDYRTDFDGLFDVVFVDGIDELRRDFGLKTWRYLKVGGVMIFHDTRRDWDFDNALAVIRANYLEVWHVEVNARMNGVSSNCTVVHKKECEPYVNWTQMEGKPRSAYGYKQ